MISLICTVLNEERSISQFLDSILAQHKLPDEVVIVDGGSTDATNTIIQEYASHFPVPLRLIVDPTCHRQRSMGPIGRGRNVAIRNASGSVIASVDAGCILDREWLFRITRPFIDPDVLVVGGWYQGTGLSVVQRALSLFWIIAPEHVRAEDFIPSSRSMAFRKNVWYEVGGYPEDALFAEDTRFVLRIRQKGIYIHSAEDALVFWELPASIASLMRLSYRYGFGDGFSGVLLLNAIRNAGKVILGVLPLVLAITFSGWWALGSLGWWSFLALHRWRRKELESHNIVLVPLIVLLKIISDVAYLAGFTIGWMSRRQPEFRQEGEMLH